MTERMNNYGGSAMPGRAEPRKEELLEALKSGQGIENLLNIAYRIFGNPLLLVDTSYNLLAHTENTVLDDPLWNELTSRGNLCHDTVHFMSSEHLIADVAESEVVAFLKSDKLKYDRIAGKVFDEDNIHVAVLAVIGCYRPLTAEDLPLMETVCDYLSRELPKSEFFGSIERIYEKTIVSDLLDGVHADKALLEGDMQKLYAGLKSNLYIAVVDMVQYEKTLTHLAYFRDLFRGLQGEYEYFIYVNNIVIIISTDYPQLRPERDLNALQEFFNKYNMYAGISGSFQNLFELQKYYRQALNALNYGQITDSSRHVFVYDDFRVDCYLHAHVDDIQEFCNPLVFTMRDYDLENGTSYFDVLYAYLLTGRSIGRAAGQLSLTEDEVQQQLCRMGEVFDIDWSDGTTLAALCISMKMVKYHANI